MLMSEPRAEAGQLFRPGGPFRILSEECERRIVEQAPAEMLFRRPLHPYTIGLMGSLPSLTGREQRLATIPGSVPAPERMPEGCRFGPRCPFVVDACRKAQPQLVSVEPGHDVACIRAPLEQHVTEAALV
jgi:peptide/nickel transport system ATP-binding protein